MYSRPPNTAALGNGKKKSGITKTAVKPKSYKQRYWGGGGGGGGGGEQMGSIEGGL